MYATPLHQNLRHSVDAGLFGYHNAFNTRNLMTRRLKFRVQVFVSLLVLVPAVLLANDPITRFATFNIAMGLPEQGALFKRLQDGKDENLRKVAAVIQQVRPDVILLNEFDYLAGKNAASLFIKNYLSVPQYGGRPIRYAYSLDGPVNTGIQSGLDLDRNGKTGDAADAWGFGKFPGQYGMLVLSRFPLKLARSFQRFKWADMPAALQPTNPDGTAWYPQEVSRLLRLSSKSHWDIEVDVNSVVVHFLVSHPSPPVFDGPENRNGVRNHDEIRFWADYIDPGKSDYIHDDSGVYGGLARHSQFVIAGDMNADPVDGDSTDHAMLQLLDHPRVNATCLPVSDGAREATQQQGGVNRYQKGNPGADSGDFNDKTTGNMRIDYVLPSARLKVLGCGVYWPASNQPGHELTQVSDHHLVWVDLQP